MNLEGVKRWDDAQAYCFKEDTRIEEAKEYGKYIAHKQKVSNAMISKKTGASLSELRDVSKEERVELMRKKLIETNNIEETLMDMYKEMPCSMYETEMALKQAKLQKKLNQVQEAKQDAEQVIMRTWQKQLEEELQLPADPRNIVVYVDTKGNRGKSFFKNTYAAKYPNTCMYYEEGKAADIKHVISNLEYDVRVIFLDLSRQVFDEKYGTDFIDYKLMESLKNGAFTSCKYSGTTMKMKYIPHFVVFSNKELEWDNMSRDRWIKRTFVNDNDVKEETIVNVEGGKLPIWTGERDFILGQHTLKRKTEEKCQTSLPQWKFEHIRRPSKLEEEATARRMTLTDSEKLEKAFTDKARSSLWMPFKKRHVTPKPISENICYVKEDSHSSGHSSDDKPLFKRARFNGEL